jgi:type VI secretion system secreted protein VgrG
VGKVRRKRRRPRRRRRRRPRRRRRRRPRRRRIYESSDS